MCELKWRYSLNENENTDYTEFSILIVDAIIYAEKRKMTDTESDEDGIIVRSTEAWHRGILGSGNDSVCYE